ncbi:hypothetical protein FACS1894219_09700 [Clostridia bacterium]|nr:hypothetical protein FACS1894219_09700 [Clostridia bacterium]
MNNIKKVICIVLSITICVMPSVVPVFAEPTFAFATTEKVNEELTITSYEEGELVTRTSDLNNVPTNLSMTPRGITTYSNLDEQLHENCIYSCEHYDNPLVISSDEVSVMSKEQSIDMLIEYDNITSDEEMESFIAKYSEFPVEDIDLDSMRNSAEQFEYNEEVLAEYDNITTDDEMRSFIAKYSGIPVEDVDLESMRNSAEQSQNVINEYSDVLFPALENSETETIGDVDESIVSLFCDHYLLLLPCQGKHSSASNCNVFCERIVICILSGCGYKTTIGVTEVSHTWSVGWCGQTCRKCSRIELFHAPGGCSHCD